MGKVTVGDLIAKYLAIRDKKKELDEAHKKTLAPLNEALDKLEMFFHSHMVEHGLESLPSDSGTAYTTVRTTATVADWDAFRGFVEEHGLWHMLEKRVSKQAAEEYLTETGELPPGVNMKRDMAVNVRRN